MDPEQADELKSVSRKKKGQQAPEKKAERRKRKRDNQKELVKARKSQIQSGFNELVAYLATVIPRNAHGGTNGDDLAKFGAAQLGSKFKGVFAANTHPANMDAGAYVINTDPYQKPGVHWTAVYDGLFYDSFDRRSAQLFPYVVLPRTDKNPEVAQDPQESNCGERCLAFLICAEEFGVHAAKRFL